MPTTFLKKLKLTAKPVKFSEFFENYSGFKLSIFDK